MDVQEEGRKVFRIEIEALRKTMEVIDETFLQIIELITTCSGKIIVTGMGKPGHIATKIAATFASLGTPSFYLHPAEAMHGDLGVISRNDVVIAISYSGESDEIIRILPIIKLIGAKLVGITGNKDSTLAQIADVVQVLPDFEEACYLGLAPTSSTTTVLCYGDALAVVASEIYGFSNIDFGKFHPAGLLGKRLLIRVDDLMVKGSDNPVIGEEVMLKDAIVELSKKGLGIVTLIDEEDRVIGVVTDGDLRRQLEKGVDVYNMHVKDAMSRLPITIESGKLAVDALRIMKEKNISCIPVILQNKIVGTICLREILKTGIVI